MSERRLAVVREAQTVKIPAGARPFVRYHQRYERWFERHRAAYLSELLAVRALLP